MKDDEKRYVPACAIVLDPDALDDILGKSFVEKKEAPPRAPHAPRKERTGRRARGR